jgi:hypothetical protein
MSTVMVKKNYRVSKVFEAPLDFVYSWCTDFREDDNKIIGSPDGRHIVDKTKKRFVWIRHYKTEGKPMESVRIVKLKPPNLWFLDGVGDEDTIVGKYELTPVGKNRTRLVMNFTVNYRMGKPDSKKKWEGETSDEWDDFKAALEKDFRKSIIS